MIVVVCSVEYLDERVATTIKFFGQLTKRNENYEPNRLFLRKWFGYWVILEDHYLRFYKNVEEVRSFSLFLFFILFIF